MKKTFIFFTVAALFCINSGFNRSAFGQKKDDKKLIQDVHDPAIPTILRPVPDASFLTGSLWIKLYAGDTAHLITYPYIVANMQDTETCYILIYRDTSMIPVDTITIDKGHNYGFRNQYKLVSYLGQPTYYYFKVGNSDGSNLESIDPSFHSMPHNHLNFITHYVYSNAPTVGGQNTDGLVVIIMNNF